MVPGLVYDDGVISDTPGLVSDDSDTDTSDEEEEIDRSKEVDPRTVPFHFIRTGSSIIKFLLLITDYEGKSKKEGVLITHNMFKFQKNNASRDYSTWWYTCSHKNTHGCSARAIIKRREFMAEDGELMVENELVEVATAEVNSSISFIKKQFNVLGPC
jgi:hypothetical protein